MTEHKHISVHSGPYLLFTLALSIFALLVLGSQVALDVSPQSRQILDYADWLLCLLFFIDFILTMWRTERRWHYFVRWGWIDLLSCIPSIDSFRSARLVRVFRIFRVLRAVRAAKIIAEFILEHRAKNSLLAAAFMGILLVIFASIGILHFESVPDANIKSAEDAIWWTIVTITTVGYGDKYPITTEGRALASLLIFCGVALIGVFTAYITFWFMKPDTSNDEDAVDTDTVDTLRAQLAIFRDEEIQALRREIELLRAERDLRNAAASTPEALR